MGTGSAEHNLERLVHRAVAKWSQLIRYIELISWRESSGHLLSLLNRASRRRAKQEITRRKEQAAERWKDMVTRWRLRLEVWKGLEYRPRNIFNWRKMFRRRLREGRKQLEARQPGLQNDGTRYEKRINFARMHSQLRCIWRTITTNLYDMWLEEQKRQEKKTSGREREILIVESL